MKFQDSSFNGLKVTVGTKSVTHARSKSNMPHQLFQSWGHKNYINVSKVVICCEQGRQSKALQSLCFLLTESVVISSLNKNIL